jgi:hypothetical protein
MANSQINDLAAKTATRRLAGKPLNFEQSDGRRELCPSPSIFTYAEDVG